MEDGEGELTIVSVEVDGLLAEDTSDVDVWPVIDVRISAGKLEAPLLLGVTVRFSVGDSVEETSGVAIAEMKVIVCSLIGGGLVSSNSVGCYTDVVNHSNGRIFCTITWSQGAGSLRLCCRDGSKN